MCKMCSASMHFRQFMYPLSKRFVDLCDKGAHSHTFIAGLC